MKILLDTHAFLWAISGNSKLSDKARSAYLDSNNELFFSTISYWEIGIKISIGKLELDKNWQKIIDKEMNNNGIKWLDLKKEHVQGIINLKFHHRDPFDRLLIAQAKFEQLTVMTIDKNISKYNVKTLW
jgi:PIN domain nuclease of toxin-antitoxin system